MNNPAISRRHVLATLGLSATAGCLSSASFLSEDGIQLGSMYIQRIGSHENGLEDVTERELGDSDTEAPDDGRTYPIRLFRDGSTVFTQGVTLAPSEYVMVDPDWSTKPAGYTLLYATRDNVSKLEISPDISGVNVDKCNHIVLLVGFASERGETADVQVYNSEHEFIEQSNVEWTC